MITEPMPTPLAPFPPGNFLLGNHHEFRPERFLADQLKPRHRLAFMPFGAGHRVCVGNAFALTESMLLLAMIARHYRFNLLPGQTVEPEIQVTLRPKGGMRLAVSRR